MGFERVRGYLDIIFVNGWVSVAFNVLLQLQCFLMLEFGLENLLDRQFVVLNIFGLIDMPVAVGVAPLE